MERMEKKRSISEISATGSGSQVPVSNASGSFTMTDYDASGLPYDSSYSVKDMIDTIEISLQDLGISKIGISQIGIAGGVASLGNDGKVPSSQLPTLGTAAALDVATSGDASSTQVVKGDDSRLDDVVEGYYNTTDHKFYATLSGSTYSDEITGVISKVYCDKSTNMLYRWTGSAYTIVGGGTQVNSDWDATSGVAEILNKPTLGDAAAKGVDSSISAASTSTDLPTSQAVASFVEGKGYVTTDTNTTYSLGVGTGADADKIVLTPSSGTADTITVPYASDAGTVNGKTVASNVPSDAVFTDTTYESKTAASGGTDVSLVTTGEKYTWNSKSDFSGNYSDLTGTPTLGTAAAKDFTTSVTSGSNDLVTSGAVYTAIDNLPEPMVFKGSVGTGGTITTLPVDGSASVGDTYKVITDGTYDSKSAKVGDTFICLTKTSSANTWELIPSGDEPSGTVTSVGLQNATNGGLTITDSPITTSGTISVGHTNVVTAGTAKGDDSKTLTFGGTFTVPSITYDANGHITDKGTTTMTMPADPNTDTKVTQTATSTNANYEVLFSGTADNTTRTEGAGKYNNLTFNPSTGNLQATQLNGVTIGSNPKFTDTTYESKSASSGGTDVSLVTTGEKYTWNNKADSSAIPSAYASNPAMDGTASPGSSTSYAKGDHVHPSDTSKVNKNGDTMTGALTVQSTITATGEITDGAGNKMSEKFDANSFVLQKFRVTVTASSWSSTATSGYYTYALTLPYPINTYKEFSMGLTGSADGTDPTAAESAAYSLVNYFDASDGTGVTSATLRAKTKPTTTFYIMVSGYYMQKNAATSGVALDISTANVLDIEWVGRDAKTATWLNGGYDFDGSTERKLYFIDYEFTIYASSWSSTVNSNGYYTNTRNMPGVITSYSKPDIALTASSGNTLPTAAQIAAYNLVNYFYLPDDVSAQAITAYAKTKPTSDFDIHVKGVWIRS